VSFEVIPALDVAGGRLVAMTPEGPVPVEAFGGQPLAAATAFVEAGARRLHLVDVDLALTGESGSPEVLGAIAALGATVQASGGVSTRTQVEAMLAAGAERVVLGSAGLADRTAAEAMLEALGDDLVIGIEADGPTIRPRGRGQELGLWDTLTWLGGLEVRRYLFTEVGRAGGLRGPDLDGIWALATHTERPVIASGGVRGPEDLRAIAELGPQVEGAVIGRALYEGLDPREALAATRD
jgi:phosphoribosylformimino-5-aminoimidazole carboxamide ribonucleotide (ProFAR) isomerase